MSFANVPPPVQYAPRENLGVDLANAALGVTQAYQQGKASEDSQQFQTAFGQAYAKGDMNAMQQLAAAHPAQWQAVQQGMTAINANNKQALGAAASDLSLAAMSGNPQAVMSVAAAHAPALQGIGVTPDQIATAYQQNPQQVRQYADMIGMHALEPKDYFTLQNQTAQRVQQGNYQQGQLAIGQQRVDQQKQSIDQQGAYQAGQLEQGQQKLNQEQQFNQAKVYDMQANRALAQGKSLREQQAAQSKAIPAMQEVVNGYDNNMNTLSNSLGMLKQVQSLSPDDFDAGFGLLGTQMRKLPNSTAAQTWNAIQGMQSQARLQGIIGLKGTGPVSDAEGQAAARAFLNIDEKTSAGAARRAVNNWQKVLDNQLKYQQSRAETVDMYRNKINAWTEQQAQSLPGGQPQQAQQPQQPQQQGGAVSWGSLRK